MHITLYLAGNDEHLKFFTTFFSQINKTVCVSECFMGYCIESDISESDIPWISVCITRFIIEFYLKEAILSKVYDEYLNLDVNDAVSLLSEISANVCDTMIYEKTSEILNNGGCMCVDSFIIFNIKPIMQNIYKKVDFLAENIMMKKECDSFVAMLRTYVALNTSKCRDALVEFSTENMCRVALDNSEVHTVNHDKLLTILTEHSPQKILLKNPDSCPGISNLLKEIFRGKIH